jgi:hypothetical protein
VSVEVAYGEHDARWVGYWLRRWRAEGRSFAEAWAVTIGRCDGEDREALEATEGAWRRAYERKPPEGHEAAAGNLRALWEALEPGEPDEPRRLCAHCAGPMPPPQPTGPPRVFCRRKCQREALREREQSLTAA